MGIEVTWGLVEVSSKLLSDFQYLCPCVPRPYPPTPLVKGLLNGDTTDMLSCEGQLSWHSSHASEGQACVHDSL